LAVYLAPQPRNLLRLFAEECQAVFYRGKHRLRAPLLIVGAGKLGVGLL